VVLPTRRYLLDSLRATNRQTLSEGHYLNPVPLHQIQERWIDKFERRRLRALSEIKRRAEEKSMTDTPAFVYVTYIQSTPERVWHALTDPDLTAEYWGHSNISDWEAGARWEHRRTDGSGIADVIGTVLEAAPPRLLVMTFDAPGEEPPDGPSRVTFEIEPSDEIVRLTVTHENLADDDAFRVVSHGWAAVLSNLKSLLETGHVLPQAPWEMPVDISA
jgi:uncharacterized protein YndB with AHSA1/START domain